MEVSITGSSEITITGDIFSLDHYLQIKKVIMDLVTKNGAGPLTMHIKDSASITSAIIGLFLRLIHERQVKLSVVVGNPNLFELLDILKLIDIFHVAEL